MSGSATNVEKIPLDVLFGHPDRFAPSISPDGTHLAYPAPHGEDMYLWVRKLDSGEERRLIKGEGYGIFGSVWTLDSQQLLYVQDDHGDENWHLLAVRVETGESRDLTPFPGVKARLVALSRHRPTHVLVGMNKEDPSLFDVYLLDLKTGVIELVAKNPGDVSAMQPDRPAWFADIDLEIRARTRANVDGSLFTGDQASSWRLERSPPLGP